MSKTRTIIVAVALSVPELYDVVPEPTFDPDDLQDYINSIPTEVSIVSVYDRDRPINNFNPEVFTQHAADSGYLQAEITDNTGPDFTEGMNEAVPITNDDVPMAGRMPNCCGVTPNQDTDRATLVDLLDTDDDEALDGYR